MWARPPAGLSYVPTEQSTKRPPSTSIGLGAEWEMKPVQLERYGRFASRVDGFCGWPVLEGQPLRWRLGGDADDMGLNRCGEGADRPVFHTLTEQLRPPTSRMVQWIPF